MRFGLPSLVSLLLVSAPVIGSASFDLALLPTYSTADAVGKVRRYDPENNVRLGDFAEGNQIKFVDYNSTSGNTYVHAANGTISRFNYSTGIKSWESSGYANTNCFVAGRAEANVYYGRGTNDITRENTTTLAQTVFTLHSSYAVIMSLTRTTSVHMLLSGVNSNGDLQISNFTESTFNFTTTPVTTVLTSANLLSSTSIGQMTYLSGTSQAVFAYRNAANSLRLGRVGVASGAVTGFSQSLLSMPGLLAGAIPFIVPNHNGFYAYGESAANAGTFLQAEYDINGNLVRTNETNIDTPGAIPHYGSIVLAPEPSGLMMWGTLMGAAMLRRRKA